MKIQKIVCMLVLASSTLVAKPVSIVKVPNSKYNASARLKITSPPVLKKNSPILVLVSNFPIGVDSKSQAYQDLGVPMNKAGSRVLLAFSNGKRIYVSKNDVNLLTEQRSYFNKRFRVKVTDNVYNSIRDSNFIISSMLVNSYGESIKNDNAFYSDVYAYNQEKQGMRGIKEAIKKPYLVYNEPFGTVSSSGILLDFFVKNAIISPSEHKVDVYIDNKKIMTLNRWQPYVIENLSKGKHEVRIELVDASGKLVPNKITKNSSTIYVK